MGDALYDEDFYTWTQDQAAELRKLAGHNRLDVEHLAEEVADLGRSELNKVESHLRLMLTHLIEAAWVTRQEPQAGWRGEVRVHQLDARKTFTPGMRQHMNAQEIWADAWKIADARLADHGDDRLPKTIPCPLTLDQLLSADFDPEEARERVAEVLADTRSAS